MRNVVLARIDDRLIHGQIVTAWVKTTDANVILIADDKLMQDSFTQRILKAAAPPAVEVILNGLDDAAEYLAGDSPNGENIILLVKDPIVMKNLCDRGGVKFERIILGGMGAKAGRQRFNKNISASPEEVNAIREIIDSGTEMFYQLVPKEVAVNVRKIL